MAEHANFYENLEEAQFRLRDTIVLYDGAPVHIVDVENHSDGTYRVRIYDLPYNQDTKPKSQRKLINSKYFDKFRPFEVGNVNFLNTDGSITVYRGERLPVRTRYQGTTANCFTWRALSGRFVEGSAGRLSWTPMIHNEGFIEAVKNIYPTFDEYIKADINDVALARDVAVRRDVDSKMMELYYKNNFVGFVSKKGSVILFEGFAFAKEALEETKLFSNYTVGF